jgi:hypothetical protein
MKLGVGFQLSKRECRITPENVQEMSHAEGIVGHRRLGAEEWHGCGLGPAQDGECRSDIMN